MISKARLALSRENPSSTNVVTLPARCEQRRKQYVEPYREHVETYTTKEHHVRCFVLGEHVGVQPEVGKAEWPASAW